MRIAMINITGGGMSGGYRAYLHNVLPRFAVYPDVEAILCATPPSVGVELWFPSLPKVSFIPCVPFRFLRHRPDRVLEQAVSRFAPDVIFIPVERYLRFDGIPLVVMLQNMGPLAPVAGNPISERLRYIAQRHETKIAVRHADRVIVPTNFVRGFLTDKWHIPKEKVTTIYYGASVPSESLAPQKPAAVPEGWADKFLFTAGSIEPYRGLEDVLEGLRYLHHRKEIEGLAIAGEARKNMKSYERKLKSWIDRHGLTSKVRWIGVRNDKELSWCYRNCKLLLVTSRVESFGLIGLEALAHGCIVVAANNPPFPEVFGNNVLFYQPYSAESLAHSVEITLEWNLQERSAFSKRAKDRAASFSWDRTADQTVEEFKRVVQQ